MYPKSFGKALKCIESVLGMHEEAPPKLYRVTSGLRLIYFFLKYNLKVNVFKKCGSQARDQL